jgi:hypothetical protein
MAHRLCLISGRHRYRFSAESPWQIASLKEWGRDDLKVARELARRADVVQGGLLVGVVAVRGCRRYPERRARLRIESAARALSVDDLKRCVLIHSRLSRAAVTSRRCPDLTRPIDLVD